MIRGLYTSAIGMMTQMNKMDVVSNNIANSDTTGFKKDTTITQSFSEELAKRLDDPKYNIIKTDIDVGGMSLGVSVNEIVTDFSNGNLKPTENVLDAAINGSGFFAVNYIDKNGNVSEKYKRDGQFTLTAGGILSTKDGYQVLGENGPITIQGGDIRIDENGNVFSGGEYIDRLKLVDFENKESLRKYGENLYDITDDSNQIQFSGKILQGHIENSNINVVQEMVKMITLSRTYEANQKMIQTHDSTLGRAVNELGKK